MKVFQVTSLVFLASFLFVSTGWGQFDFDTGGQNTDFTGGNTGDTGNDQNVIDPTQTGTQGTAADGSTEQREAGTLEGVGETLEDERFQGYVGPTRSQIEEQLFVGPSQDSIESVSGSATGGGGGRNFNTGGGGGGGGFNGFGGTQNGFVISRSSVRARVKPNFAFAPVSSDSVIRGFQLRLNKLPIQSSATNINIQMSGTTAVITGTAQTKADIDNVLGQLRMEPGVYRIMNDVKIAGQNPGRSGFSSSSN